MLARLYIASVAIALYALGRIAPFQLRIRSSREAYEFTASLDPLLLIGWVAAVSAFWVAFRAAGPPPNQLRPGGLVRRFAGFFVDSMLHLILLLVPATAFALLLEAAATGTFAWHVERSYSRTTDAATVLVGTASMIAFVIIYSFPATRGRQTPGGVSLGLFLRASDPLTLRRSVGRSLLGLVTLAAGVFTIPAALSRADRRMWHDLKFNTSVVSAGAA